MDDSFEAWATFPPVAVAFAIMLLANALYWLEFMMDASTLAPPVRPLKVTLTLALKFWLTSLLEFSARMCYMHVTIELGE